MHKDLGADVYFQGFLDKGKERESEFMWPRFLKNIVKFKRRKATSYLV